MPLVLLNHCLQAPSWHELFDSALNTAFALADRQIMQKYLLILFFVAIALSASAEYRVFELIISKKTKDGKLQPVRSVTHSLDPIQYPEYYPLNPDEIISYVNTWMCRGNTSQFKPYCPNPKKSTQPLTANQRSPAANQPKK